MFANLKSGTKVMLALLMREFLESRKLFLWVPAIFVLCFNVLVPLLFVFVNAYLGGRLVPDYFEYFLLNVKGFSHPAIYYFLTALLMLVYLYTCVRKEYEEGAVNFWRSLPPADGMVLMSKILMATVLIPIFVWGVMLVLWGCAALLGITGLLVNNLFASQVHQWSEVYPSLRDSFPLHWTSWDFIGLMPIRTLWLLPLVCFFMLLQSLFRLGSITAVLVLVGCFGFLAKPPESLGRVPGEFVYDHMRFGVPVTDARGQVVGDVIDDAIRHRSWETAKSGLSKTEKLQDNIFLQQTTGKWKTPVSEYLSRIPNSTFFPGLGLSAVFFWLALWLRKRHARW